MHKPSYFLILLILSISTLTLHAQWTKTNGVPGGHTSKLITYGDTVLANVGSQLCYSTNHGKTWTPIAHPSYSFVAPVAIDGQNIFGYAYDLTTQKHIWYQSDNFFQTLNPITLIDTANYLQQFFLAHGYLYAREYSTSGQKLLRTMDYGATWEFVHPISPSNVVFDGQRIVGTLSSYIIQSTDQGFTWDTLLQYSGYVNQIIQHENHLTVFTSSSSTGGSYVSDDFGFTWQYFSNNALNQFYRFVWHNERIFGFDGNRMIQSSNFGQTWETVQMPMNTANFTYQGVSSGNTLIIGGMQGVGTPGMFRSIDNGNSWPPVTFGLVTSSGKLRKSSHLLYVSSPGGLYRAVGDWINWQHQPLNIPQAPNTYWTVTDFIKPFGKWLISDGTTPWYSTNEGGTWTESIVYGFNNPWPLFHSITDFEVVKNKIIAGGNGEEYYQFYISHDQGISFDLLESLQFQHQTAIKSIAISGSKAYALTSNRKLYRSDDGCITWVLHSQTMPSDSLNPYSFDENSLLVSGNVIMASVGAPGNRMLYSKDNGQTWVYYNLPASSLPWGKGAINDMLHIGNHLVVATQNGIYTSENDGIDWTSWNEDLSYPNILDLEIHYGYLWASSAGGGIWKRPLTQLFTSPSVTRSQVDNEPLSISDQLQITPNPASQLVQIATNGQLGELILYDIAGNLVMRRPISNANESVSINQLPNGVYQVVFTSKKMSQQGTLLIQH